MRWTPERHHRRQVEFLLTRGGAGVLASPGLGKTSCSYKAFDMLRKERVVPGMLVVAPLRPCYRVWPKERDKWQDFHHLRLEVLHGPGKDDAYGRRADVYVVNVDGLKWLLSKPDFDRKFKGWLLVVDESTKFKSTSSVRFKMLRPRLKVFKRRWILTGTPAPNGLADLFGQVFIVDMGEALGRYITYYRMKWFDPTGYGGYTWVVRSKAAEAEIYDAIAPVCVRLDEKDYLKMPPVTSDVEGGREPTFVDLPERAAVAYAQMETLLLTRIRRREVTAANAAVAMGKCSQIANGGIYTGEGARGRDRAWALMHSEKSEAVADLVEQLQGKPALIAYEFHHDLARLKKALGDPPHIGEGVSMAEVGRIEEAWNRGELTRLLVQPQSVAHGLNMQEHGQCVIWHSLTWDYELYDQLFRRVYRSGQRHRVFLHHVLARNTVDEVKLAVLRGKERTQGRLFAALLAYAERKAAKG